MKKIEDSLFDFFAVQQWITRKSNSYLKKIHRNRIRENRKHFNLPWYVFNRMWQLYYEKRHMTFGEEMNKFSDLIWKTALNNEIREIILSEKAKLLITV